MKTVITLILLIFTLPAWAQLKVVSTTPDLTWLIKSIGKDKVSVATLLNGTEDPHYADAMPSWIAKASNADVFCMVGMELEVGWVPRVLERSSNAKIQTGGKGHCDVGKSIKALEVPTGKVDRSMGDVHGSGNPHYHLGPEQYKNAARGIFEVLVNNDPDSIETYSANLKVTLEKIDGVKSKVKDILKNAKSKKLMSYHKEFSYFVKDFGLTYVGDIEETPGVPPSAGRIARVALDAKTKKVDLVLASDTNPTKLLEKFNEISGVRYRQIPISIRSKGSPSNYEELLVGLAKAISEDD